MTYSDSNSESDFDSRLFNRWQTGEQNKGMHYRSRLDIWADIIRILSEYGPCQRSEILRKDRSLQYGPLREHLHNLVGFKLLNVDIQMHSRSWKHRVQKYSVSEKGHEFYKIMQEMIELCQPVVVQ